MRKMIMAFFRLKTSLKKLRYKLFCIGQYLYPYTEFFCGYQVGVLYNGFGDKERPQYTDSYINRRILLWTLDLFNAVMMTYNQCNMHMLTDT